MMTKLNKMLEPFENGNKVSKSNFFQRCRSSYVQSVESIFAFLLNIQERGERERERIHV